MKVMISQPMKGKTTEQIRKERESVIAILESKGYTIVDSVLTDIPPETANEALWCLGKSLEIMSTVDAVYFMEGWESARGCIIEHMSAEKYGISVIHQMADYTILKNKYELVKKERDVLAEWIHRKGTVRRGDYKATAEGWINAAKEYIKKITK